MSPIISFLFFASCAAIVLIEAKQPFLPATFPRPVDAFIDLGMSNDVYSDETTPQIPFKGGSEQYKALSLPMPINHFPQSTRYQPHTNDTFDLYYYFEDKYYIPGGPVFILDGGETSAKNRLPFLHTGILDLLSRHFNGISVVLEHRYYGKSVVTDDLSTDSLRFLTTEQSLADSAYFIRHVRLPGLGSIDWQNTPVIYYGGSYAGGKAAFMRKLYPDLVYGAIASSGVVLAEIDSWRYFEPIRNFAPPKCIQALEENIAYIDSQLSDTRNASKIKEMFELEGISHDEDFVGVLSIPLSAWQGQTWQKDPSNNLFFRFCNSLEEEQTTNGVPSTLKSHARFIKNTFSRRCRENQDECFGTFNKKMYQIDDLSQTWRLWTYQYCTEWGYFMGAPPEGHPSLLSRLLDTKYATRICQYAFPDGKHNKVPSMPNITEINKYGTFSVDEERLAFIDGQFDPWVFATPHSDRAMTRNDTLARPFKVIAKGVHHYDEYGNPYDHPEPSEIAQIHAAQVEFVGHWLQTRSKR